VTDPWTGRRRVAWGIVVLVLVLVLGEWAASFVTTRLWEGRVSEAAALVGTRFALLTAGLEVVGLAAAVGWFVANFLAVVRSALHQFESLPHPLGTLSDRTAYGIVAGAGIVVGIGVGGGTGGWLEPVLLAANGVTVGVRDLLLQVDLGLYLADLPLWELLYRRAVAMFVPAALGVVVLAMMSGTLAVRDQRLWLAPSSRWHVAILMIIGALLIGWNCAMSPYRLAAARTASIGPAEFLLRTTVAQVVALFAATAAVLTFLWGARLRFVVALGGWVGLGLAMLGGTILIQSRAAETPPALAALRALRRLDTVAYGIRLATAPSSAATEPLGPSLWEAEPLARLAEADSARVIDVLPGMVVVGSSRVRTWFVLRSVRSGEPALLAVADDRIGPSGGAVSLRWGDVAFTPGLLPYLTLSIHHARPGAPDYDLNAAAPGISLGSPARRIVVAWARQIGAVLRAAPNQRLAWNLDPVERLSAVAPFIDWGQPRVVVADRDAYWVSDGFVTAAGFPSSQVIPWRGGDRSFVRAGFVGVVRARGGETHIFLRPDADSLSTAWSRIAAPLVEPPSRIPEVLPIELGVPAELAAVQARVLQGGGWLNRSMAPVGRGAYPIGDLAHEGTLVDPHSVPFLSEAGELVDAIFQAPHGDPTVVRLAVGAPGQGVPTPKDLQQRWERFPFFQQLRDSIKAAGSDYSAGTIRFGIEGDTLIAYQPVYAVGPGAKTGVVMVNVAMGQRLGAGRSYQEAWQNLRGEVAPKAVGSDVTARLEEARQWLDRADAALKRGDLAEFGRAFSYLRALLGPGAAAVQGPDGPP
jgi:uncharacterized membrane protein (UPF0182 family)